MEQKIANEWYVQHTFSLIKKVLSPLVRLIWIKQVTGMENIPSQGAAIIAFNHQSYFDFLCFIAVCPRLIHFLSAEKFFSNLLWLPLMKLTGQIRVNRHEKDKHILHITVHEHLTRKKIVGIFPEGTRAPDPDEMLKAFTGVTKYAIKGKVPIIPVGLVGTHEVMSRHDSFPKFRRIVQIHVGKPIHFSDFHDSELTEDQHRHLTDQVMFEISRLSGKRYPHALLGHSNKPHESARHF